MPYSILSIYNAIMNNDYWSYGLRDTPILHYSAFINPFLIPGPV